ncbi:hypothetical protein TFLX_03700 [Thermoflexales bacterium]|nr:hypothetical protein TFLX_03700 [Thermoflexales bacterium]
MRNAFFTRRKDLACLLMLAVLATLFMGESLLPDKMLAPLDIVMQLRPWSVSEHAVPEVYNGLPSDKVLFIHPLKVLTGQGWRQGLPLWEPHILSGYPVIGNAQAGIFYPGILPYIFLNGAAASNVVALFHLIMAGVGTFGYLRALRLRHAAALLGASVFMFNTGFAGWLMWDSVAGAMVWLPWALWAFEAALDSGRWRSASLGAVAFALTYLGGHLQWSLYVLLILVLYGGFRFIVSGSASRKRIVGVTAILLLGGTALALIQLLPTLEYIASGHRQPLTWEELTSIQNWPSFLMLWVPRFFGSGYLPPDWWGPVNYNESIIFVGIIPLILALTALGGSRKSLAVFFGMLGIFGVLCAADPQVYRLLAWLPGFNSLGPVRMRFLTATSLSMLSALGLDWLLSVGAPTRRRGLISIFGATIIIGVAYLVLRTPALPDRPDRLSYVQTQELEFVLWLIGGSIVLSIGIGWRRWGTLVLASVCGLTLIQLWPLAAAYQQPVSTRYYYPTTPAIDRLTQDQDLFRILTTRGDWFGWPFKPDLPALYNLQDVGGYDSQYLQRYVEYTQAIDRSGQPVAGSNLLAPSHFDSPLVDLLNVKYAITLNKVKAAGWELIAKEGMRIYQRSNPLPRAWIAAQAEVIGDDAAILDRLVTPDFDPRQTVVLEQVPSEPLGEAAPDPAGTVSIETYANTRLVLKAEMQRAGWLVLSEVFYPGWHITVDGQPAELYRANYILRAVPVSSGQHRIEMWFMPDSFVSGATISLAAAVLLLILSLDWRRKKRQRIHSQVQ